MSPIKKTKLWFQRQIPMASPITPLYMSTPLSLERTEMCTGAELNNRTSMSIDSLGTTTDFMEQESGHGLLENLRNLLDEKSTTDITFLFDQEDKKLKAHRLILSADSKVFSKKFFPNSSTGTELQEPMVWKIEDFPYCDFSSFIDSFYKTNISISNENIKALLKLAHTYEARNCLFLCSEYLKRPLEFDNVWLMYELALEYDFEQLVARCKKMIMDDFSLAISSNGFIKSPKHVVRMILQFDTLNRDEVDVFQAMIKWAHYSCTTKGIHEPKRDNLRKELVPFFKYIRFSEMDAKDFISCHSQYKILNIDELNSFMDAIHAKRNNNNSI